MAAKFEMYKDKAGEFRWRLRHQNTEIIASGEGYTTKANCLNGILAQRLIPSADKKRRVLATELLLVGAPARRHIRESEFHQLINVIQTGRRQGMHSMDDSLFDLYESGEITYEAAINNANDPTGMRKRVHEDSDVELE